MYLITAGRIIKPVIDIFLILAVLVSAGCIGGTPPDKINYYSVYYDPNNADDGFAPSDYNDYTSGDVVTIPGNQYSLTKSSHSFAGWNTETDGSGITYTEGETFTMGASDVIFYAVWSLNADFIITYNSNDAYTGTVPEDDKRYIPGSEIVIPGNTGNLVKTGFKFGGWNTAKDGTGISYKEGDVLKISSSDVILFAVWLPESETRGEYK